MASDVQLLIVRRLDGLVMRQRSLGGNAVGHELERCFGPPDATAPGWQVWSSILPATLTNALEGTRYADSPTESELSALLREFPSAEFQWVLERDF